MGALTCRPTSARGLATHAAAGRATRSEEHTSELQSLRHLVCRLLLEKKKEDVSRRLRRRGSTGARGRTAGPTVCVPKHTLTSWADPPPTPALHRRRHRVTGASPIPQQ